MLGGTCLLRAVESVEKRHRRRRTPGDEARSSTSHPSFRSKASAIFRGRRAFVHPILFVHRRVDRSCLRCRQARSLGTRTFSPQGHRPSLMLIRLFVQTRALSNEWSPKGINVNSIAPGYIATDVRALAERIFDPSLIPTFVRRCTSHRSPPAFPPCHFG
jgi:hypothetical protein